MAKAGAARRVRTDGGPGGEGERDMGGVRGSDVGGMDVRAWRVAVIIWATSRTTFLGNYGRFSGFWTEVRRCPALIYTAPVLVK